MWKTDILSPAKINLHLDVAPPGGSGFHPLRSLFVMVSLYDRLSIAEAEEGCFISSNCPFPERENILYKAWELCRERGFFSSGLRIHLEKTIPSGAGLGGGSGDCATLLRVLKEWSGQDRTDGEWMALAAELGSDVPFFMESTAAVVTGRGEFIRPVAARTDYHVLIVFPGIGISTASAFSDLDRSREAEGNPWAWGLDAEEIGRLYHNLAPGDWPFFNSFQNRAFEGHPQLARIGEDLLTRGADFVTLSGSGSAMAGIFTDVNHLNNAQIFMKSKFPATYAVLPLDIIPYGIVI